MPRKQSSRRYLRIPYSTDPTVFRREAMRLHRLHTPDDLPRAGGPNKVTLTLKTFGKHYKQEVRTLTAEERKHYKVTAFIYHLRSVIPRRERAGRLDLFGFTTVRSKLNLLLLDHVPIRQIPPFLLRHLQLPPALTPQQRRLTVRQVRTGRTIVYRN
jgi:hypothetical protein